MSDFAVVSAEKAAEVCTSYDLEEAARPLLTEEMTPQQFVAALCEHKQAMPAIRFLAHALPKREAIWWGSLCVWFAIDRKPERLRPEQREAMRAAVAWVLEPSEENRRAAEKPGKECQMKTCAGCLALGAFWSGGSMTPAHLPAVAPKPFVTARAVAGCVLLAATLNGGKKTGYYCRQFLTLGNAIAAGKLRWEPFNVVP